MATLPAWPPESSIPFSSNILRSCVSLFSSLLKRCGGSNLSKLKLHLFWIHLVFGKRSSVVVQICPKRLCTYGFVNKFWTGRIFERLWKVCGGSSLSTVLLLWGIYIKKCISPVRICLQTRNARNASTKFRKTSESKKAEKSLEISAFLVFPCLHLNQTRIMSHDYNLDAWWEILYVNTI